MNDSPKKKCSKYIGVPYKLRGICPETGWDCWGLVQYIGKNEFSADWPTYKESHDLYTGSNLSAAKIITQYLGEWKLIEKPSPGDVVCFSLKNNFIFHVGLVLNKFEMIHVIKYNKGNDSNTRISRFDTFEWAPYFAGCRRRIC